MANTGTAPSAAKRPRTDDPEVQRSAIWYSDGNVILQTPDGMQFRVFRGILSENSPVFADMFSIPQPDNGPANDCPIVELSDDSEDLTHALKAIFDRNHLNAKEYDVPFARVRGALRIGTKYEIADLRRDALELLRRVYPAATPYSRGPVLPRLGNPIAPYPALPFDALALALECHAPALLPRTFYACAQHGPAAVLDSALPRAVQTQLLAARERMLLAQNMQQLAWLSRIPAGCVRPEECDAERQVLLQREVAGARLRCFESAWAGTVHMSLCDECVRDARKTWNNVQGDIFYNLPELCGMDPWAGLLADTE